MSAHGINQDVSAVETKVSFWARAVAARRTLYVGIAGTAGSVLAEFGVITPDLNSHVQKLIAAGFTGVAFIAAGTWIHQGTTPADVALQPKSSTGVALVGADVAAKAVVAAATPLAAQEVPPGLLLETGDSVIPAPAAPVVPPVVAPTT